MEKEQLSKQEIIEKFGPWSAMSIYLGNEGYTLTPPSTDHRMRRFVQTVADLAQKPIDQLRLLDLACLEGHYAIEFAMQGARTVGIEGREGNFEKAYYAKEVLGLDNCELYLDDVRNLSKEKYGSFDVVLCSGILYHLSVPDVFEFVENIYDVTGNLVIFDTATALRNQISIQYKGREYSGLWYTEHDEKETSVDKESNLWASLDNEKSFWFTHASLCNLLEHTGFSSVYESINPSWPDCKLDRRAYIAIKGQRADIKTSPVTHEQGFIDWPEIRPDNIAWVNRNTPLRLFIRTALPQPVKDFFKPMLRKIGLLEPDATQDWEHEMKRRNKIK